MPTKFMQSLDPQVYAELRRIAKDRGITRQELIRAVIVPDWMRKDETPAAQSARRARTAHEAVKRARTRPRITA
jgi:Ribbon-helix-helix protein, copG family